MEMDGDLAMALALAAEEGTTPSQPLPDEDLAMALALAHAQDGGGGDDDDEDFQGAGLALQRRLISLNRSKKRPKTNTPHHQAPQKKGMIKQSTAKPRAPLRPLDVNANAGTAAHPSSLGTIGTGQILSHHQSLMPPDNRETASEEQEEEDFQSVPSSHTDPFIDRAAYLTTEEIVSLDDSEEDLHSLVKPPNSPLNLDQKSIGDLQHKDAGSILNPAFLKETQGSQFSALLRLCETEDCTMQGVRNDIESARGASNSASQLLAGYIDVGELSEIEQDEDVMSLMTQRRRGSIEPDSHQERSHNSSEGVHKEFDGVSVYDTKAVNSVEGEIIESKAISHCPICRICIASMFHEQSELHINNCLDKLDHKDVQELGENKNMNSTTSIDMAPVLQWLESLGLSKFANVFSENEIDWDTLKWLTEEDITSLGIAAIGPRRKILHALEDLRNASNNQDSDGKDERKDGDNQSISNDPGKKLITDFFVLPPGSAGPILPKVVETSEVQNKGPFKGSKRLSSNQSTAQKRTGAQFTGIPPWISIPGTNFLVDGFKYSRRDCSHWFLTHFHTDHYQGLTKGFRYGQIYCSLVTAKLVNSRIGVPWNHLRPLPLNEKINIEGVNVTFLDANHCPGSVMILFEIPNGKAVLHTGDFRFCEEMETNVSLQSCKVHTLVLDTTYCSPQYDFPKQETVIQFVIDAIQAEAFNPNTLFLIGTYTIGKERLFLEVARVLEKKVYLAATKLRLLQCMEYYKEEDLQWLTSKESESHIHVVPLWMVSSFKRISSVSRHYHSRYNSIVAFSPTGWSYGRDKKRISGRRYQQGTIVRYEVPYSEHCSFQELQHFVKLINPVDIIPSVNNKSAQAADAMVAILLNEEEKK